MKMLKPSLVHAIALIACINICVVAPPTLAHFPGGGGGIHQCVASIIGMAGCVKELLHSVLRLEPQLVGPACCNAFLQIDESCWPKMFPLRTSFPPQLKKHCLDAPEKPQPPPIPSCSDDDDGEYYDVEEDSDEGGDCEYRY